MNIKEIITEEVVDEYQTIGKVNPIYGIESGELRKHRLKLVNTPLTQFNVRYDGSKMMHEYFLYDKKTDKCVGTFAIQMQHRKFDKVLKPGIQAVIPHIGLARRIQGQGVATQIYTTFLRGGPWVFVTFAHSAAAAALWDRLATGDIINVYVDEEGNRIKKLQSDFGDRMIGPKDRFL
jgi:hypothetical protein